MAREGHSGSGSAPPDLHNQKRREHNLDGKAYRAGRASEVGHRAPDRTWSGRRTGSRRDSLLALIRENSGGLSRGEILEKMGLKGNNTGEMSFSNALTALTKTGQVNRDGGQISRGCLGRREVCRHVPERSPSPISSYGEKREAIALSNASSYRSWNL